MNIKEFKNKLESRKNMLERKLETKKQPHWRGVNPTIISDAEAVIYEIENILEKFPEKIGEISDGYHTFNELYYHRMILFSIICNTFKDKSWKSLQHNDGAMYDDYFIVGITTEEGDYTYHYEQKYWDMFNVKVIDKAPIWDGHKPSDITRLLTLLK